MIGKIEHLGIAVKDLAKSEKTYAAILNTMAYKREIVESEHVETLFFKSGENKIELLQALSDASPIAKFIEKRGEGIHHIAFDVDDIHAEMQRLVNEGFQLIHDTPKRGADNKLICFLHPKHTHGVLIELCQEIRE
ncbi:MAG: methylmalonyl-CoA epimerase [Lewinellaceae bacterium]|nr:methylmalonyl-CoA epimerase [Lewinellaceae bacterium]